MNKLIACIALCTISLGAMMAFMQHRINDLEQQLETSQNKVAALNKELDRFKNKQETYQTGQRPVNHVQRSDHTSVRSLFPQCYLGVCAYY